MKGEKEMNDYQEYLNEQLEDVDFADEWEGQTPEHEYIKAIIAARMELNLTQKELSKRTGIRQSNISRIENGNSSPTIATLQQIASGMDKTLHIEFRQKAHS